jgi:hypothetical protein
MTELEMVGIPGVCVASEEFQEAAAAQAASLGFQPAVVWVAHPIQDRTDEEMRSLADAALEAVLNKLTG